MRPLLFDLDGTLTDPGLGIYRSLCFALERMGRPIPEHEIVKDIIGPPLQHVLPQFLGSDDPAEGAACLAHFRERYAEIGLLENEAYPGIDEALKEIKAAGHRMFVATSKPKVYADRILNHFGLDVHFDAIYGSELDGRNIAKADLIGSLLQAEKLAPKTCLMIGDRAQDVVGAHANGMPCLGVLYGYGTREELLKAGAEGLCESPAGLSAGIGL